MKFWDRAKSEKYDVLCVLQHKKVWWPRKCHYSNDWILPFQKGYYIMIEFEVDPLFHGLMSGHNRSFRNVWITEKQYVTLKLQDRING